MKKFVYASSVLALGLFASCSNDAPEVNNTPIDEEGNIGYICFNLTNSDTRAGEEEVGTTDENSIKHVDFLFTDVNNRAFKLHVDAKDIQDNKALVKLPKMPKYVAVIVNGQSDQYDNLLDISDDEVPQYCNGNDVNKNFYMSSSRYWDASHQPVYRTNITSDQVYKDEVSAKAGKPVEITVERYVGKVNVSVADVALEAGQLDPLTGEHEGHVKDALSGAAIVKFEPKYVFLTGVNNKGYRIKKLPNWSAMPEDLTANDWCNDLGGKRSFWVGNTAGVVEFATLNELENNKAKWAKAYGSNDVFYPFENKESKDAKKTSVVVAGVYTVTNAAGQSLADTDGSFYLVAFEDNFTVCKTEADAIKAMGGKEGDTLIAEGADGNGITAGYDDDAWTGWTGWMKIKNSPNVIRCIKYNGGWGYYSKEIIRRSVNDNDYCAIVRNHVYRINITGISGMGVGIPDPDQPIINIPNPSPLDQNYLLNMSVKVAAWRVVPAQDVAWQ